MANNKENTVLLIYQVLYEKIYGLRYKKCQERDVGDRGRHRKLEHSV